MNDLEIQLLKPGENILDVQKTLNCFYFGDFLNNFHRTSEKTGNIPIKVAFNTAFEKRFNGKTEGPFKGSKLFCWEPGIAIYCDILKEIGDIKKAKTSLFEMVSVIEWEYRELVLRKNSVEAEFNAGFAGPRTLFFIEDRDRVLLPVMIQWIVLSNKRINFDFFCWDASEIDAKTLDKMFVNSVFFRV